MSDFEDRSEESRRGQGLSRRGFVRAAGCVAAATALAGASSTALATTSQAVETGASDDVAAQAPTDGSFTASAASFGWTGPMTCQVTFKDGRIADIQVVSETDSATGEWFASARDLLIPRIIDAQSLGVDSIAGATFSSAAIKECVAGAIDAAGGDSDQWYEEPAASTSTEQLDGYDVVVVGLGGSGIMSFCAAAYQGAKVFGMEAAGKVGGDSSCTYGPMALNSEYLKDLYNDGQDYIDESDVYDTWMQYVGTDEKSDVVSLAVYNSGSALDFYNENFGFEFTSMDRNGGLLGSFIRPDWDKMWCVYTADQDNTSWNALGPNKTYQFTRALERACQLSPESSYLCELRAIELILDGEKVAGVRAVSQDGTTYEIRGANVILATGGFIGNADMMSQYLGAPSNVLGVTLNDGTGIQMGVSAGGATYSMGTLPMIHISQVTNIIRTDNLTADQKAVLTALALTTEKPMATIDGDPWGLPGQDGTAVADVVYAPGYRYYVLYTQDDVDALRASGLTEAQAQLISSFINQGGTLPAAGTPVSDIDQILEVGEQFGNVTSAQGVESLAKALDMDAEKLDKTASAAGIDADATLYAVACCGYAYATVGGLDVDADMRVLRQDGTAIENLFAVGQDSEGVCNVDGKPYTPWGGQAQSWTFVSGQIAGTVAAGGQM